MIALIATAIVGFGILVSTILGTTDAACDGGLGQWSVPVNTILLIMLAVYQGRTRRKVEKVKEVTDAVALRKPDARGRVDVRVKNGDDT